MSLTGSKANHRPSDYHFARTQNLYTPSLERTPRVWGTWCADAIGFVGLVLIGIALHIFLYVLFDKTDRARPVHRTSTTITHHNGE